MSDDKPTHPMTFKGRGAVLAAGRPTERQPLRRAGDRTHQQELQVSDNVKKENPSVLGQFADNESSSTDSNSVPLRQFTSTLSPLAPEFVPNARPSSNMYGYSNHHIGVASSTSSSGPVASSTYPSTPTSAYTTGDLNQSSHSNQHHQAYENGAGGAETESEIAVEHLRTIIYEITVNPGKFDVLASLLVDALSAMLQDEQTLYAIVDQIFEQAVSEANFRYNGARLCNHFVENLNVSFPSNGFRAALFQRCQQEFGFKDVYAVNNVQRLRDFTMFIGELFIHIEVLKDGNCQKVAILGSTVPQLLKTLLHNPLKDNVKCVCQMLKFTGAALEDFERLNNNGICPVIEELFHAMQMLCSDERVDRNCRELLIKVIELRSIDWGRIPLQNEPPPIIEHPGVLGDPVMYGPDGLPLSNEEALFLESNAQCFETNGADDDGCDIDYYGNTQSSWSASDGMDDEMAAAFEKFLLESS